MSLLYNHFSKTYLATSQEVVKDLWKNYLKEFWSFEFELKKDESYRYLQYKNATEKLETDLALKNKKTHLKEKDVIYTINKYNFRGKLTFDDIPNVKSVAIGDSWTVGEGVPEDKIYTNLLEIPTVNLGCPGASLDQILRLTLNILENFHIEYLFIMIPEISRIESITITSNTPENTPLGPWAFNKFGGKRLYNKFEKYIDYADDYDLWVRCFKNIKLINYLAEKNNVKLYYSYWSDHAINKIEQICYPYYSHHCYAKDKARDGMHPGIEAHQMIADDLNNSIKKDNYIKADLETFKSSIKDKEKLI